MKTEYNWRLEIEHDKFDSAENTVRIIDASQDDHPQGPMVVATVNVRPFAPHVEQAEAIGQLLAASPLLLSALESFISIADVGNATGEEELAVFSRAKLAVYLAKGGEKFARKCSITGVGMNEGWTDGDSEYAATKEAAETMSRNRGFHSLRSATYGDDPVIFWTTWEVDEANEGYYLADGTFIEPAKP